MPTTNSFLYTEPFTLTNSVTVSANAFETNFNNSVAANALFFIQPLFFTSAMFDTNSRCSTPTACFQLGFAGTSGQNYVLQATTNFTDWTPLSTNLATTNFFNLFDNSATNFPYRFYRVIQQ